MRIVVCVKQVPNTDQVRIDPEKGTLIREGVPSILNPDDAHALEAALQLKDEQPETEVIVLTMGPPQAQIMLRECLAMGADRAVLLSDRVFGGADTCATSTTLAAGIRYLGEVDLIFAGRQAIDGDTAQVGPQVARRLGLPVVTYVQACQLKGDQVEVERRLEDGYEKLTSPLPCLLTVVGELNQPRYMNLNYMVGAFEAEIETLDHTDLGLDPADCGLKASPTRVWRSFTPPLKGAGQRLTGNPKEQAIALIDRLIAQHLI